MNAQTPGPLTPRRSHEDHDGPLFDLEPGETRPITRLYSGRVSVVSCHDLATIRDEDAALLANAYTAFDHAGRELGVDAAELAASVDLAEVIRYALDYAQLHTARPGDVGRTDQTKSARMTLAPLAALLKVDLPPWG